MSKSESFLIRGSRYDVDPQVLFIFDRQYSCFLNKIIGFFHHEDIFLRKVYRLPAGHGVVFIDRYLPIDKKRSSLCSLCLCGEYRSCIHADNLPSFLASKRFVKCWSRNITPKSMLKKTNQLSQTCCLGDIQSGLK